VAQGNAAGDLTGQIANLEVGNALRAASGRQNVGPDGLVSDAQWADDTKTGDDDAAHCHGFTNRTGRLGGSLGEKGDGITKSLDRLGGIVRDLYAKFFFEGHHEFDLIERVRSQIVHEAGLFGHLVGFDVQMLHDDLTDAIFDVAHSVFLFCRLRVRCLTLCLWAGMVAFGSLMRSGGILGLVAFVSSFPATTCRRNYHTFSRLTISPKQEDASPMTVRSSPYRR